MGHHFDHALHEHEELPPGEVDHHGHGHATHVTAVERYDPAKDPLEQLDPHFGYKSISRMKDRFKDGEYFPQLGEAVAPEDE